MRKIKKSNLNNAQNEKKDKRAKHILAIKEVVAQLLIFLVPMFKEMSVEQIVRECLKDPEDPNDPFVKLLSEEENAVGQNNFIQDLKFLIKLPQPIVIGDVIFKRVLINFEPQNTGPGGYSLVIRKYLYDCQEISNENRSFGLKTTKETYQEAVPLWSFWFFFSPKEGRSSIDISYFNLFSQTEYDKETDYLKPNETNSFITNYQVNIGNDFNSEEKNVYSFLHNLLISSDPNIIIKTFQDYNFKVSKEEINMFMTGIEKKGFEEGKAIGLDEGKAIGRTDERKVNFDNAVRNYMKKGKNKEQAIKEALEILSLEKIPE